MDDDFLSLMDDNGDTREDLKCPDGDIGEEIKSAISEEREILVCIYLDSFQSVPKKRLLRSFTKDWMIFSKTVLNSKVSCRVT